MSDASGPISDGVRAASLLEEACQRASPNASQIEVMCRLALDLKRQLDALANFVQEDATPDILVEAAICCADLANLAACNAPDLPPDAEPYEATRLAAGAVAALVPMIEAGNTELGAGHAENLLRDARSAGWRAKFAARLAEGPSEES